MKPLAVPFLDLARRMRSLQPELGLAIARSLESGQLLLGPELAALERQLEHWSGHAHAVAVGSGTDALSLALRAIGVGPGDEVIVPAFTAVPTAAAACAIGATPVPVDIDPDTACIDALRAKAALTSRTKAIIPVHLYGRPAEIDELARLGIPIIEDAAQAHGALGSGPRPSRAIAYSFYPTKNLGGIGDGGAVITEHPEVAAAVRRLRHHGMRSLYVHEEIATNSRMSEVEAVAIGLSIPRLAAGNARRREIARRYRAAAPTLGWQSDHPDHVFHLCVARVPDREAWRAAQPFGTAVHYPLALTQQPAYRQFARHRCPNAEAWAAECVSLPCFPELNDDEVRTVCEALA